MSEQNQNQNNNPTPAPASTPIQPVNNNPKDDGSGGRVSTTVGVLVLLIIAGTIAFFTYEFLRIKNDSASAPTIVNPAKKDTGQAQIGVGETVGVGTTETSLGTGTIETGTTGTGTSGTGINFTSEIGKLDAQVNTVDTGDYSESIISDGAMGLE